MGTTISRNQADRLRLALDALLAAADLEARAEVDPVGFVRAHPDPRDAEVAAVFAALMAFGRVSAFRSVLEHIFVAAGGSPRRWVLAGDFRALDGLYYRWVRSEDLVLLAATLGEAISRHAALASLFEVCEGEAHIGPALDRGVGELRSIASEIAGLPYAELPRGLRHLLPTPAGGSASKRWCMLLRWMSRREPPDLGLWDVPPSRLVIPLDTHVFRIARWLGLTRRATASWATAVEITANLARIHPDDPVRYDFAIAHLGISGQCRPQPEPEACRLCALVGCCQHG